VTAACTIEDAIECCAVGAAGRGEHGAERPWMSVVIVSYETRALTLACIRSALSQAPPGCEIVVIDNASSDGSADAIAAECPGTRLIRSAENLGFAAANNAAVGATTGDYVLLLNPDTVVLPGAFEALRESVRRAPHAGIWGGRTVFANHTLNPASCWRRQTLWSVMCAATGLCSIFPRSRLFNPEAYGGWPRDDVRDVDIVSGCFLVISRSWWDRLGGFDPGFFMYGEDADLCLRAKEQGARPMITPDATIIHYGGQSEPVRADKMVRLLQAKVRLMRVHWDRKSAIAGVCLLAAWPLTRFIAWRVLALCGRRDASARAESWKSIWCRRRQWL
jgi:GT2 family glycosyltransferase